MNISNEIWIHERKNTCFCRKAKSCSAPWVWKGRETLKQKLMNIPHLSLTNAGSQTVLLSTESCWKGQRTHKQIGPAGRYGNLEISHSNNLSEKELRFRGTTFWGLISLCKYRGCLSQRGGCNQIDMENPKKHLNLEDLPFKLAKNKLKYLNAKKNSI